MFENNQTWCIKKVPLQYIVCAGHVSSVLLLGLATIKTHAYACNVHRWHFLSSHLHFRMGLDFNIVSYSATCWEYFVTSSQKITLQLLGQMYAIFIFKYCCLTSIKHLTTRNVLFPNIVWLQKNECLCRGEN